VRYSRGKSEGTISAQERSAYVCRVWDQLGKVMAPSIQKPLLERTLLRKEKEGEEGGMHVHIAHHIRIRKKNGTKPGKTARE